jgi:hypothetical protein
MNSTLMADYIMSELKDEILQYISKSEKQCVEFKRSHKSDQNIKDTILAFANAKGGIILLGVEEISEGKDTKESGYQKGNIVSDCNSSNTDVIKRLIVGFCENYYPKVELRRFEFYQFPEGRVYLIEIPESIEKPVGTQAGLYKIRYDGANIGMDPTMLRRIILGDEGLKEALIKELKDNLPAIQFARKMLNEDPPRISTMPLLKSTLETFIRSNYYNAFIRENNLHFILRKIENCNLNLLIFNTRVLKADNIETLNKLFNDLEEFINIIINKLEETASA